MLITHTPVDDGVLKVWHGLLVKSPNRVATAEDVANARAYQESSRLAFAQDFDIWANKRRVHQSAAGPYGRTIPQGPDLVRPVLQPARACARVSPEGEWSACREGHARRAEARRRRLTPRPLRAGR